MYIYNFSFEVFMKELAKYDKELFQEHYADLKYLEAKVPQ